MALAADTPVAARAANILNLPIGSGVTVFAGSLVGLLTTTGRAVLWSDVANLEHLGHALEGGTGDAGGTVRVSIEAGDRILEKTAVTGVTAETDVGTMVHATDDNTFTLTPGANAPAVGRVIKFHTGTTVDVLIPGTAALADA